MDKCSDECDFIVRMLAKRDENYDFNSSSEKYDAKVIKIGSQTKCELKDAKVPELKKNQTMSQSFLDASISQLEKSNVVYGSGA